MCVKIFERNMHVQNSFTSEWAAAIQSYYSWLLSYLKFLKHKELLCPAIDLEDHYE